MPSLSTELSPIGDQHKIKFHGPKAAEAAKEFFGLPIQLPAGDFLVVKEKSELHIYGLKNGISKFRFTDPNAEQEFGEGVIECSVPGHLKVVLHQRVEQDRAGSFGLVKKLIPVADQVVKLQELKGKTYKSGQEAEKAADIEIQKDLLKQIQAQYSAKEPDPDAPAKAKAAAAAKPKPAPAPAPRPRPVQQSYTPSYSSSNYSPSSG